MQHKYKFLRTNINLMYNLNIKNSWIEIHSHRITPKKYNTMFHIFYTNSKNMTRNKARQRNSSNLIKRYS